MSTKHTPRHRSFADSQAAKDGLVVLVTLATGLALWGCWIAGGMFQ